MKKSFSALALTLLAAAILTGCNNNNGIYNPPGTGTNCGNPPNSLQVVYPIPGAKHVNPNITAIYVATNGTLPSGNSYNFFLNYSQGQQYTGNFTQISASSLPSPHATPTFSNPIYYATPLQYPLGPIQGVQVFWNDGGTGCTPNVIVSTFATS
jgi:hypothetical protein